MDYKLGMGVGFLGAGDLYIGKVEFDMTRKLNRYFSYSGSLQLGHGMSYDNSLNVEIVRQVATTIQYDQNLLFSPFKNDGTFNLKIGIGPSFMYTNDVSLVSAFIDLTDPLIPNRVDAEYNFENRLSFGGSLVIEPELKLGKNLVSLKLVAQPYLNGDSSAGVMLKFGRILAKD